MLWSINSDSCRGGCANRLSIHRPLVQGLYNQGCRNSAILLENAYRETADVYDAWP